jgi:hypothetical protein
MSVEELDRVQAKIEELIPKTSRVDYVRAKIEELLPETQGEGATSPAVGNLLVQAHKFLRKAVKYPGVGSFPIDAARFLRKAVKQIELERKLRPKPRRAG